MLGDRDRIAAVMTAPRSKPVRMRRTRLARACALAALLSRKLSGLQSQVVPGGRGSPPGVALYSTRTKRLRALVRVLSAPWVVVEGSGRVRVEKCIRAHAEGYGIWEDRPTAKASARRRSSDPKRADALARTQAKRFGDLGKK